MKITLAVDTGEGPVQVTTNFMNVIEWERKYKRRAAGVTVPLVFDDYAKRIVSLEVVSQDDTNPTPEVPGAAG